MKLDIGCGKNKLDGFTGMDRVEFPGVDIVHDARVTPWPMEDGSVEEVHCSHFLEHLTKEERVGFFNELYRVLKVGGQARIITPHWSHERAYGDPTHEWPPVTAWLYFYLLKSWREANAPHADSQWNPGGYSCDFDYVLSGVHDPNDTYVAFRNMETKVVMMSRGINTTTDLIAVVTRRG